MGARDLNSGPTLLGQHWCHLFIFVLFFGIDSPVVQAGLKFLILLSPCLAFVNVIYLTIKIKVASLFI